MTKRLMNEIITVGLDWYYFKHLDVFGRRTGYPFSPEMVSGAEDYLNRLCKIGKVDAEYTKKVCRKIQIQSNRKNSGIQDLDLAYAQAFASLTR